MHGGSEIGRTSRVVTDLDGPRRGGARQRSQPRLSHRLVDGQQGLQRRRVRVAGHRHLTQDVRQLTEEDASAGVPTIHLVDKHWLVILHSYRTCTFSYLLVETCNIYQYLLVMDFNFKPKITSGQTKSKLPIIVLIKISCSSSKPNNKHFKPQMLKLSIEQS